MNSIPLRRLSWTVLLFAAMASRSAVVLAQSTPSDSAGSRTATRSTAVAPMRAVRASAVPTIDGRGDDAVWRTAPVADQFLEYEPRSGAESRFRTEIRVAYDDRALYVLARMFDPAPDSIVSLLSRRDVRTASEQLKLVIDSYHDRRTAYQFAVNPAGVKRDFYVYNDDTEDQTWDAVWDVGTSIDSLGWVAEFRIPFSQLRFPVLDEHTFGLLIVRDVARSGERISWPLLRRNAQGYVSQAGELTGLRGIPTPRRLEVSPYALTKNVTRFPSGSSRTHPQLATAGADLKFGLTSNLTLDAAVNPDFGQVEADPSVLNLSAFEPFFEERRPFFLEGAGIFTFNTFCEDINDGCRGLFYSRRIGRAPQLSDEYGTDASPQQSTIAGAAKLTGRTAGGLSLGVLDAVTPRIEGSLGRTIEPTTNYAVARVQQDLAKGQSGVGAMVTMVSRNLDEWTTPWLRSGALTGGVDARHRFGKRNYEATMSLSASNVRGDTSVIRKLQLDGVHRYQRPDAALALDTTRTALTGFSQRVSIAKFGGGITRFQVVYQRSTPGFETNDLGFQQRADEQLSRGWFSLQLQKPSRVYRQAYLNFNTWGNWTSVGLPTENGLNTNWHVQLPWQQWIHLGSSATGLRAAYDDRVARGGPAIRRSRAVNGFVGVEGDSRKPVVPELFLWARRGDDGETRQWSVDPSLTLRASSRFSMSVYVGVAKDHIGAQWLRNEAATATDSARYLFARLRQTTFRNTLRFNVTATPTLSLQVWAQPFITAGTYSDLVSLRAPRAERFRDRFVSVAGDPGGFEFRELRSNIVGRWEYRPGSTLFLVWQHGRSQFTDEPGRFELGPDVRGLFGLPANNTFLLKASYWLNP
jgi:Domain of unknown function (DUF5916)/Carbohydrate family 9 binding domain-like